MLRKRNLIDAELADAMGKPMASGHLGEWLAARIFDIGLVPSSAHPVFDGHFRSGQLAGRTVNVKWYLKREGMLDISDSLELDFYLVLCGPPATPAAKSTRPWLIDAVYLFDAQKLHADLRGRNLRLGIASSVRNQLWADAQIHPPTPSSPLRLASRQHELLSLFRS